MATAYYKAIEEGRKNDIPHFYHPEIEFTTPLGHLKGVTAVTGAAQGFSDAIRKLCFRTKIEQENEVMMVCDAFFNGADKALKTAIWMIFEETKIRKIECFYDPSEVKEGERKKIFD